MTAFGPWVMMAIWVLTGMTIGLWATVYGACRSQWRIWPGLAELLDWVFFIAVAILYVLMLFWSDWGIVRVWSLVGIALGYGLWAWLAAPFMFGVLSFVVHVEARAVYYMTLPVRRISRRVARPLGSRLRSWLNQKNPPAK